MAPESERANWPNGTEQRNYGDCYQCGFPRHQHLEGKKCPPRETEYQSKREPTLTCSEVVERLPSEPCPACGDRNRCPSCKHHEGNPHDATCRAFRAQLKKFIHDSCRQIPDDDGSISDLAAALVKQYPGILHSWRERRVQELEECLRKYGRHLVTCPHLSENMRSNSDCNCGWAEWREQIRKGANHD